MTVIDTEIWKKRVQGMATESWLAYAHGKTNTTNRNALERFVARKNNLHSSSTSNKFRHYGRSSTSPSASTINAVEVAAPGSASVIKNDLWRILAGELIVDKDDFGAMTGQASSITLREYASTKLPILAESRSFPVFDRFKLAVSTVCMAVEEGDYVSFKDAQKQIRQLVTELQKSRTYIKLAEELEQILNEWLDVQNSALVQNRVNSMNDRKHIGLLLGGCVMFLLPFFTTDPVIVTCSIIAGVAFFLGGFDPRIRNWQGR